MDSIILPVRFMQEVASATVRNSRKAHLPEASRCTPMTIGLMPGPTWAEVRGARLGQCAVGAGTQWV